MGILGVLAGLGGRAALAARRSRRIDLRGRVVVVTGGGRGLGFAISRAFLKHGCKLAICGRDGEEVAKAVASFSRGGADVFGTVCDASEPTQVDAFIAGVIDRFGAIDVLVNNAGQCFVGPAVDLRPEDVEAALRNIFWVHFYPTAAVLAHMRSRGFGRIVNITSIGGKVPIPHQAAYAVGKYAATGWSETLAVELAKEGVLVSTITPPPLKDGAPLHVHFGGDEEAEFQWFTRMLTAPWSATDADRTARAVVDAAMHGDPERAISATSWLLQRLQGLAPGVMTRLLALADRRMPPPPGPTAAMSSMRVGAEVLADSEDAEVQALGAAARADARRYRPAEP